MRNRPPIKEDYAESYSKPSQTSSRLPPRKNDNYQSKSNSNNNDFTSRSRPGPTFSNPKMSLDLNLIIKKKKILHLMKKIQTKILPKLTKNKILLQNIKLHKGIKLLIVVII